MGMFDCATGSKLGILPVTREHIPQSGTLSFSPDGTEVVCLGMTLKVIDLQGKVLFDAPTPEGHVLREDAHPLQYTPDGRGILVGGQKLVDRRSGKLVWDFDPLFRKHPGGYVVNDKQICTPVFDANVSIASGYLHLAVEDDLDGKLYGRLASHRSQLAGEKAMDLKPESPLAITGM